MAIRHVYSQTVADGTATSVVRPSDWNSVHNQTLFIAGNTAGASSISGSDVYWAGGNNITLSANGSTVSVVGAAQTVQTQPTGAIAGTGFTSTTTTGTAITAAMGSNGLSMAVPQYITTFVNDLTSGRAGTGFTSTTTAGTAITAALGTNGLSMAVPQYITTFVNDLTSGRAGTGSTTAGTNASLTLGVNTNGVALSVNVPKVDFTGWNLIGNTAGTTSTGVTTASPIYFSGGNNVTLSGNSNTIVISAAAGGAGGTTNQTGPNIAANGNTVTSGTVVFSNSNGVSFGLNGSTMTASVLANRVYDGWAPYDDFPMVAGQQGNGTVFFDPGQSPYFTFDRIAVPVAYTNASNSTGSVTLSYHVGIYTRNVSSLSLSASTSFSATLGFSGTVGSWSLYSGMRLLTIPWTQSIPASEIYIANLSRTSSSSANASISQMLVSNINSNFVGFFGVSQATTRQWSLGQGIYTTTSSGLPNSVAFSQIRGSDSVVLRPPAVMFVNGTV